MSYVICMRYVSCLSYASCMKYVGDMNYINYMSYVSYMRYVFRCLMNYSKSLKIPWKYLVSNLVVYRKNIYI